MEILKVIDLKKTYGDKIKVEALRGVDFSLNEGELVAIVGESGSGKTTLMNLISGVDKMTSGHIEILGNDIGNLSRDNMTIFRRRNIGVVYQFFNLIPNIDVRKNILLPILLDNKKPDFDYLKEVTDTLAITELLERYPNELSGGQKQRVAIARSIITKPLIVLADEPTGNLDSKNSKEIVSLFRLINKNFKSTIVIITHDVRVANSCDRVFEMIDGKLEEVKRWNFLEIF